MPKIRQYQSRTTGAINPVSRRAARAGAAGQGLMALGRGVSQLGQGVTNFLKKKEDYEAQQEMLELNKTMFDELEAKKKEMGPNAEGYADAVEKSYQQRKEEILGNTDSSYKRQRLSASMEKLGVSLYQKASVYETNKAASYAQEKFSNNVQGIRKQVIANPEYVDTAYETISDTLSADPYFDETQKQKLSNQVRNDLYDDALNGQISSMQKNPNTTLETVDAYIAELKEDKNKFKLNSSEAGYARAINQLEGYRETLSKVRTSEDLFAFQQEMNYMSTTGMDRGLYDKSYVDKLNISPARKAKLKRLYDTSLEMATEVTNLRTMTFEDIGESLQPQNMMAKLRSEPEKFEQNLSVFKKRQQIFKQDLRRYEADPVAYVVENDTAAQDHLKAYQERVRELEIDPTAGTEEASKAAKAYASYILAKQNDKYPTGPKAILPLSEINKTKKILKEAGDGDEGTAVATAHIQQLAQVWGDNFPTVINDLKVNKAFGDAEFVAASMWSQPQLKSTAEDLVAASRIDDKEIKATIGEAESIHREEIAGELSDFRESLVNMEQGMAMDNYKSIENAATKLYRYRLFKGESVGADDIIDEVVNSRYTFEDGIRIPNNQVIMGPKGKPISKPVDADIILDAQNRIREQLSAVDLVPPPGDAFNTDIENRRQRYFDAVIDNGKFVNDLDKGLRLVDENGDQVYLMSGEKKMKAAWTWDELEEATIGDPIQLKQEVEQGMQLGEQFQQ